MRWWWWVGVMPDERCVVHGLSANSCACDSVRTLDSGPVRSGACSVGAIGVRHVVRCEVPLCVSSRLGIALRVRCVTSCAFAYAMSCRIGVHGPLWLVMVRGFEIPS